MSKKRGESGMMIKGRVVDCSIHGGHVTLAITLGDGTLEELVRGADYTQRLGDILGETHS